MAWGQSSSRLRRGAAAYVRGLASKGPPLCAYTRDVPSGYAVRYRVAFNDETTAVAAVSRMDFLEGFAEESVTARPPFPRGGYVGIVRSQPQTTRERIEKAVTRASSCH